MVIGMGRSLRMRRNKSAEIMVFSKVAAVGEGAKSVAWRPCQRQPSEISEVRLLLPMGLHENAVDVVDVDDLVSGADGLDQATDAEIAGLAQHAIGGTHDEVDGGLSEGVVAEADAV